MDQTSTIRAGWTGKSAAGPAALTAAMLALYAPVLAGMARAWWTQDNASHGFLIPLIAAYLAWSKRCHALALARRWGWGLPVLAVGLGLYPAGLVSGVEFAPDVSLL